MGQTVSANAHNPARTWQIYDPRRGTFARHGRWTAPGLAAQSKHHHGIGREPAMDQADGGLPRLDEQAEPIPPPPIIITEEEVVLSTAAAVRARRKNNRWWSKPTRIVYAALERSCMGREIDRL